MAFSANLKDKFPPKKPGMPGASKPPMAAPMPETEELGSNGIEDAQDSKYIDDIMGQDIEGEAGMEGEDKLNEVFEKAGIQVSPEKLARIQEILDEPEQAGAAPGMPGKKSPMGGGVLPESMDSGLMG